MQLEHVKLKRWFLKQKRDLPWRETGDPYAIWVSEIMLQQTQVSVVIPYYEKWMKAFPTIKDLSSSSLDSVIKNWEGLGYYSRARNLHEGARFVLEQHGGNLPDNEDSLKKIKGIGPYTVGAIMSFAFHKKKAAVDGNVIRVLTRVFDIHDDVAKPKTINNIRELTEQVLPDDEPWIVMEALIELGATICTKKPKCLSCPLNITCKGFLHATADLLPSKSTKFKTEILYRNVLVISAENKFLVKRGKPGQIMSGLYEFPFIETKIKEDNSPLDQSLHMNLPLLKIEDLEEVTHSFTRFKAILKPSFFISKKMQPLEDHEWLTIEELNQFAFSSGHKKIFDSIKNKLYLLK